MSKLGDFDAFGGATPPVSPAANGEGEEPAEEPAGEDAPAGEDTQESKGKRTEKHAEPSANGQATQRPARLPRAVKRAEAPAQPPVEMDKATKALWRTGLQNAARKYAVDRARVIESADAWSSLVVQARALGVAEHVIVEAAAGADVELPE